MPRLMSDDLNTLTLYDNISNSEIKLFYRTPTTEERAQFSSESIQRKRNKVLFRTAQARQKFGMKILEGFREGDFVIKKDGKLVSIASDGGSPNYDPQWREYVRKYAIDIVELLAAHVFDAPAETIDDSEEKEPEEPVEDAVPEEDAEKN